MLYFNCCDSCVVHHKLYTCKTLQQWLWLNKRCLIIQLAYYENITGEVWQFYLWEHLTTLHYERCLWCTFDSESFLSILFLYWLSKHREVVHTVHCLKAIAGRYSYGDREIWKSVRAGAKLAKHNCKNVARFYNSIQCESSTYIIVLCFQK